MSKRTPKKAKKITLFWATYSRQKPVKAWAIVDDRGVIQCVRTCDSPKFIWRVYVGKDKYFTQKKYEQLGYRAVRVTISFP